ncbi:MAG TPA: nuclease-related domain-containing protein, partial [Propionicimonas sp.]
TDERSWRVGADGEETVGGRLEKLRADGWRLLHSVPVGNRGSDIDHVLLGPGGIYTLNTKTHPDGKIWVGKTTVMVNGHKQPYLRNSRFEADRAARLLSAAVGWSVEVTPALVFLTGTFIPQITIKDKPEGVIILDRLDLPRYFRKRQPRLTPSEVAQVFEYARRSITWC